MKFKKFFIFIESFIPILLLGIFSYIFVQISNDDLTLRTNVITLGFSGVFILGIIIFHVLDDIRTELRTLVKKEE